MSEVWLITGASRGLGRAFTEEALKSGYRVLATARNSEHLVDFADKFGKSVRTVSLDVTNEAQAKYAIDAAIETEWKDLSISADRSSSQDDEISAAHKEWKR
jgi:NADP-dependent 3-hydroxy acid dehydrogenase YdfG